MLDGLDVISNVLGGLGGTTGIVMAIKTIADIRSGKGKSDQMRADATKVVADTAVSMLGPLHDEVDMYRAEISRLRKYAVVLIEMLKTHGYEYGNGIPVMPEPVLPSSNSTRETRRRRRGNSNDDN